MAIAYEFGTGFINYGHWWSRMHDYELLIAKSIIQIQFLIFWYIANQEGDFDKEIESLGECNTTRLNLLTTIFPKQVLLPPSKLFFEIKIVFQIITSHLNTFSCFPLENCFKV